MSTNVKSCSSQQVSFWEVHTWVQNYLDTVSDYPMCGTPAWCRLPDDSPLKRLGHRLLRALHPQRVMLCGIQGGSQSRAIAASTDWAAVGREAAQLNAFRKAHPWMTRRAAR